MSDISLEEAQEYEILVKNFADEWAAYTRLREENAENPTVPRPPKPPSFNGWAGEEE